MRTGIRRQVAMALHIQELVVGFRIQLVVVGTERVEFRMEEVMLVAAENYNEQGVVVVSCNGRGVGEGEGEGNYSEPEVVVVENYSELEEVVGNYNKPEEEVVVGGKVWEKVVGVEEVLYMVGEMVVVVSALVVEVAVINSDKRVARLSEGAEANEWEVAVSCNSKAKVGAVRIRELVALVSLVEAAVGIGRSMVGLG